MATVADADAAVEHLVELDRRGLLPFEWYQIGPRRERVEIVVPASHQQATRDFFAEHVLRRPDGTPVPIEVSVRAGESWVVEPESGAADHPDRDVLTGLLGLGVHEAASRASARGWVVRAHESEALLTAELRPNRVNLQYSEAGRVVSVRVG